MMNIFFVCLLALLALATGDNADVTSSARLLKLQGRTKESFRTLNKESDEVRGDTDQAFPNTLYLSLAQRVGDLDESLLQLLEKARSVLEEIANPLKYDEKITLDVDDDEATIKGYVDGLRVDGLALFKVKKLHFDLYNLTLEIQLGFDRLDLLGEYDVDAQALDLVDIFGNGGFNVTAEDIDIATVIQIGYENTHFQLSDIEVTLQLGKLTALLNNFMGGGAVGDLVNGVISDVAPPVVTEFQPEITDFVSTKAKDAVNSFLAQYSITDIINIFSSI